MKNSKLNIFIFILSLLLLFAIPAACSGCKLIPESETTKETLTEEETNSEESEEESTTQDSNSQENTDSGNGNKNDSNQSQQKYAIVVSGASNDNQHYEWFLNSTGMAYDLLKNNGYPDKNIYYLFENSEEQNVDYEATIVNFAKVTGELKGKTRETDIIVLFLIGHGTYAG